MSNFQDRVALVTGAAAGIGLALSRALLERGARVVLADRDAAALQRLELGPLARTRVLDVCDAAAVQRAMDETCAGLGHLDYVFNNAGLGQAGEVRDLQLEHWRRVLDVNLMGVIHGTQAAYRVMLRQGSGHIVNVASMAGLLCCPGLAPYAASKAAVVSLSRALRAEAEALGVRVSVVCPGYVRTSIFDNAIRIGISSSAAESLVPFEMLTAQRAAHLILRGVARNRALIVFPWFMHALWLLDRLHPGLLGRLERATMRAFRRRRQAPA